MFLENWVLRGGKKKSCTKVNWLKGYSRRWIEESNKGPNKIGPKYGWFDYVKYLTMDDEIQKGECRRWMKEWNNGPNKVGAKYGWFWLSKVLTMDERRGVWNSWPDDITLQVTISWNSYLISLVSWIHSNWGWNMV